MTLLENWVHTPVAAALGWTLVHSLWEGALVALLLGAALLVLRSSRARYIAGCVGDARPAHRFLPHLSASFSRSSEFTAPSGRSARIPRAPPALGDGFIVVKRTAVPRGGLSALARAPLDRRCPLLPCARHGELDGRAAAAPHGSLCRRRILAVATRSPGRATARRPAPVTLLESCLAEVPVVIGYLRPVILMPVGLLAGLPAGQIESILLHELAHIRRHDYLVNLLQIVVESLVFYHPAVWWISGVMRTERENCCDDLVVATQGDAFGYAAALTALEQNRGAAREAVLAATGGSLVKRVRRLLIQPEGPRAALTPVFSAAILTVTVAAALAAWQSTSTPPRPPAAPAPVQLLAQAQETPRAPGGYAVHEVAHPGRGLHHHR